MIQLFSIFHSLYTRILPAGKHGWLLCITHTLVPHSNAQQLIEFKDVTHQTVFGKHHNYRQYYIYDVNNDRFPDVIALSCNLNSNTLFTYLNSGQSLFPSLPDSQPLPGNNRIDLLNITDFNNDGYYDILTTCWYHTELMSGDSCKPNPNNGSFEKTSLYYGSKQKTFKRIPGDAFDNLPPLSSSALPCDDFNRDGYPDLFLGTWYYSWCFKPMPKYYFAGGKKRFTDQSESSGLRANNQGIFGATSTDWNNDGWNDIITCPYDTSGFGNLFKNNGDGTFTDVGKEANVFAYTYKGDNGQPMVPWEAMPCDFDNDGDMDFALALVHGGADAGEGRTCILENTGKQNGFKLTPRYDLIIRKNPQDSHHGDHRVVWCDLNNDGWADLLIGDSGYEKGEGKGRVHICLQNPATHQLIDMAPEMGLCDTVSGHVEEGILEPFTVEVADMDMDGDEEIVVGKWMGRGMYILSNQGNTHNWIKIKLIAPTGINKSCLGTRVYITTKTGTQIREITSGQGQFSGHSTTQIIHAGLGENAVIEEIRVVWPGKVPETRIKNVAAKQLVTIGKKGIIR